MKQKQNLGQKMGMKLSPIQIQIIKLIEMPVMDLQKEIEEKLFENPALEKESDDHLDMYEDESPSSYDTSDISDEDSHNENRERKENLELIDETLYPAEDIEESTRELGREPFQKSFLDNEKRYEPVALAELSLQELLMQQLEENILSVQEKSIATYLIGNIDDSGFFLVDNQTIINDLWIVYNLRVAPEDVEKVLVEIIQEFDPIGVGARNIREYLLIQLKYKKRDEINQLAIEIITHYFEEYSNKHYSKIAQKLNLDKAILKKIVSEIESIPPRPAIPESLMASASNAVIPDFIVENDEDKLVLIMNNEFIPKLRINPLFETQYQLIQHNKKGKNSSDSNYIKESVERGREYISILYQRETTLYNTLSVILEIQKEYFLTGNEADIKPMILQDVATKVGMDVSTISRVTNGKYVQTFFGTLPVKSLFSEAVGKENISSREIKKILKDEIQRENSKKPFTDEQLTLLLQEKGYKIARRTVAKYREELKIPVARLRKKL